MKNVLLLAMSTLPQKITENYYQYNNGKVFTAQSQLEPITHMLCDKLREKGEKLDYIIILETDETNRKSTNGQLSAVEFYMDRVNIFLENDVKYEHIPIDLEKPEGGIKQATEKILKFSDGEKKAQLWIDTQGGFRDIVMVYNAIISLLKEQGIEAEGIYSVTFNKNNSREEPCQIRNQTKKYAIFSFVSAMQEFMDFGKATGLKKYYGQDKEIVKIIDSIAQSIQICQPQEFENGIKEFSHYLKQKKYEMEDPYFQIFVEFMKNDYGKLIETPDDTIEQIRWCVKKEFYQQAVTIYTEKIPEYYYKNGFDFYMKDNYKAEPWKNKYADAFYAFYDELIENKNFAELKDAIRKVKNYRKDSIQDDEKLFEIIKERLQKEIHATNWSTMVKKALERTIQILDDYMKKDLEKWGEPAKKLSEKKDLRSVLNGIHGSNKILRILFYGSTDDTVPKKVYAIQNLKEGCFPEYIKKYPKLVKMLEYYLAIKIVRNRMNHAGGGGLRDSEKMAIDFLKNEGIDFGLTVGERAQKFEFDKLRQVIREGINIL